VADPSQPAGQTPSPEPPVEREPTIFASRLLLFLAAVVLFIALLYRQHALSLLAALLLAIVGAAKLWSLGALSRLSCACRLDRNRVFPGEAVCLDTVVENAKFLPVGLQMRWSAAEALEPAEAESRLVPRRSALLWHQQASFRLRLLARRRGLYVAGPSLLRAGDLFGIFTREKRLDQEAAVVVYPRLVPVRTAGLPRRELFGSPGVKSPVEDPAYVLGTRDYQPSRPSRHMHWKASARLARLQEKVFEPSAQGRVVLALEVAGYRAEDASETVEPGEAARATEQAASAFEGTLEVVASQAVALAGQGFAVGFVSNAAGRGRTLIPPGRGPGHLPAILEALALLEPPAGGTLEQVMRRSAVLGGGLACMVFCRQPGDDTGRVARLCRESGVPVSCYAWRLTGGRDAAAGSRTPPSGLRPRRIEELRIAAAGAGGP